MAEWRYLLALSLLAVGVGCSCPSGWLTHEDSCYHFSHDTEDFPGAMKMCKFMGGQVVEIENATESTYLANQAQLAKTNYWIALVDVPEEGSWHWVYSEQPVAYRDWDHGQPDNHNHDQNCGYINGHSGHWADGTCHNNMNYICERAGITAAVIG